MDWLIEVEYWKDNQEDLACHVWAVREETLDTAWNSIKERYPSFEGINEIKISNYSK